MLSLKQPVPPLTFMQKSPGGTPISGFMGKGTGNIIRGVTLQNQALAGRKPVNTLERC